jgi:hypothetical protein
MEDIGGVKRCGKVLPKREAFCIRPCDTDAACATGVGKCVAVSDPTEPDIKAVCAKSCRADGDCESPQTCQSVPGLTGTLQSVCF